MTNPKEWVGTAITIDDSLEPMRARAMEAALDREPSLREGDKLPALWHWLYFWETVPASRLGRDGHAERGGFLPPIELPRRMWAGGRLQFHSPLVLGRAATRRARVASVQEKEGRSGPLAFVTVHHEIADDDGLCVVEEQDIVYRAAGGPAPGEPAPATAAWRRKVSADPVLLFRYSALTFNGHRIHFDRDYAVQNDGYPGLVVHGPLLATLLMDLMLHEGRQKTPASFRFRALRQVCESEAFVLYGEPDGTDAELWVADGQGRKAMQARAVRDSFEIS